MSTSFNFIPIHRKAEGWAPLALMPSGWFGQFEAITLASDVADKPNVRSAGEISAAMPRSSG